jgi:Family of unknown function (DUF5678)
MHLAPRRLRITIDLGHVCRLGGYDGEREATQVPVLDQDQSLISEDVDLEPYRGRWVAVRDGRIVASDVDTAALRVDPAVESTDAIVLVPTKEEGLFLL